MLYKLIYFFHTEISSLNVFRYITFRTILATLFALILLFACGDWVIRKLRDMQVGQPIREDGPAKHKGKAGGLIPVLEEAQVCLEYLPVSVQKKIAKELNLPLSRVYGVVTFYSFFTMTPRGKHTVRVCLGTACHLKGGSRLAEGLERELVWSVGLPVRIRQQATFRCCPQRHSWRTSRAENPRKSGSPR